MLLIPATDRSILNWRKGTDAFKKFIMQFIKFHLSYKDLPPRKGKIGQDLLSSRKKFGEEEAYQTIGTCACCMNCTMKCAR